MVTQPKFQPLPPLKHTPVYVRVDEYQSQGNEGVNRLAFSPNSRFLACPLNDYTVRLWEVETRAQVHTLKGHTCYADSVAFSPDTQYLASSALDQTVRVWGVLSGICITTLRGHQGNVNSVTFSPDGTLLVSSSHDYTVRLWNTSSWAHIVTLQAGYSPKYILYRVAFSPDGGRFACGSFNDGICLWETRSRARLPQWRGHSGRVDSVEFSPDGALLASGSHDRTIRLWDAVLGVQIAALTANVGEVTSVAFSPDGAVLASGHRGGVEVWDVVSRTLISTLVDEPGKHFHVAFSPDGSFLTAGGSDWLVRFWTYSPARRTAHVITEAKVPSVLHNEATTILQKGFTTMRISPTRYLENPSVGDAMSKFVTLIDNRRIAAGEFGEMFLGTHTERGKVAMKRPYGVFSAASLRKFLHEVDLWCKISHPYILPYLGAYRDGQDVYTISPFIENGDLMSCMQQGMALNRTKLLYEVADALAHLHYKGIIHGNFKARNILVTGDGTALLCDFGLAKSFETVATPTGVKGTGSMRWMPPEVFNGESRSMATDVYSFGITIAEVLSGLRPFDHLTENVAVMVHILLHNGRPTKEPARSPEGKSYSVLWETAEKCWVTEAKDRPYMAQVLGMLFPLTQETS